MKQDMIVILDLGSTENTVLARAIRALGVYSLSLIHIYQQIAEFTNGIDFTTCDIAKHIMAEEEDHEQDLQDYLNDLARMKAYILKK